MSLGKGIDTPASGRSVPDLVRVLGRWDLTALGVNQLIGSGIFVLPASVALLVGSPFSPLVWLLAAVVNGLVMLCFAEAATRFQKAGGPYLYALHAFGPFVAFEVAWMIWLTRVASQAALANAFALYLGYFWPGTEEGWARSFIVVTVISLLCAINVLGVREGSHTVNVLTVTKLVPLLALALGGVFLIDGEAFAGMLEGVRWEGVPQALLLLMFAFGGFEVISLPAGEARSPRQDVPRALLATLFVATGLYLLIQVVAVGTVPDLAHSDRPLAEAAGRMWGPLGAALVALGGLFSIAGTNAGTMLAGPRVTFALAEQGQLPAFFASVHRRFHTPHGSIYFYSVVALLMALTGTFEEMAAVSAVARLVFYSVTCCALPRLRRIPASPETLKLPGGLLIPALALLGSLGILAGADWNSLRAGGLSLAAGTLLYLLYPRKA